MKDEAASEDRLAVLDRNRAIEHRTSVDEGVELSAAGSNPSSSRSAHRASAESLPPLHDSATCSLELDVIHASWRQPAGLQPDLE